MYSDNINKSVKTGIESKLQGKIKVDLLIETRHLSVVFVKTKLY